MLKLINNLLTKDAVWHWGSSQVVKNALTRAPTLAYFDLTKKTVVSADASSFRLGATILQHSDGELKPVSFASQTFLQVETQYAQIQKECLAAVWAEKFDRYLCRLEIFCLFANFWCL